MKIYRIISGTKLYSFGDDIGAVPILASTLGETQNQIVRHHGFLITDVSKEEDISDRTYLVFREDLFFTDTFFSEILKKVKEATSSLQFSLAQNDFNQRYILPFSKEEKGDYRFDFKYIHDRKEVKPCYLPQKLYEFDVILPEQIVKGRRFPMPQCACFAAPIISPFHLLQVNIALNLNRSIKIQQGTLKGYFKHLKGRLGVFFFTRGLKRLNKIGKNCFIHPSAIIEGSVIGNNVRIGANSIVRMSYIGDDCSISDNVVVTNSVLANKTYISNSNYIELCMTYEEAFLIHGPYQFSIFGKNSACFAVINCDFRLDQQNIKIPTSIGVIDSQQPLLGIAYGHRSKTGGGSIIAAGRIVPNDLFIHPPGSIHLKFDQ